MASLSATPTPPTPSSPSSLPPPIAERRDHDVVFGAVAGQNRGGAPFASPRARNDPWFWLRDDKRESEEVLAHLRAENAYGKQVRIRLSASF
jgi:oligopeptidase B